MGAIEVMVDMMAMGAIGTMSAMVAIGPWLL